MLRLTSEQLDSVHTLAIGLDPIAEAVAVFERFAYKGRHQWQMPSTASIAIVLLHTLLRDVFSSPEYS